jgi:O-Antigen ligase
MLIRPAPTRPVPPNPVPTASDARAHRLQRGLTIGTAALIIFPIMFPRSASTIFMVPLVATIIGGWVNGYRPTLKDLSSGLLLIFLAFAAWSLMSAAWSFSPKATLTKSPYLIAGIVGTAWTFSLVRQAPRNLLVAVGQGVIAGLLIGGALVAVEIWTEQAIQRFIQNLGGPYPDEVDKHYVVEKGIITALSDANLKRRTTIVTMLLLPGVALTWLLTRGTLRTGCLISFAVLTATVGLLSRHQSAQVALATGIGILALASVSLRSARAVVAVTWCAAALLVVPVVLKAHATGIHLQPQKLFYSARHRIVIWNFTAQQIAKAPLRGIGADATAALTGATEKALEVRGEKPLKDGEFDISASRHAHNAFLQMWYELGAIGAIIFAAMGLVVVATATQAQARTQPLLLAQFAAVAGMIGFSFSIWQLWFQGAIGLGVLATILVVALQQRSTAPPEPA